jgi:hypothetical protein
MMRRDKRQVGEPIGFVEREAFARNEPSAVRPVAQLVVAAELYVRPPG